MPVYGCADPARFTRQRAAGVITPPMPQLLIARREAEQTSVTPLRAKDAPELYQRIAAEIRGAIDSGILAPDDVLPTEIALAERYGVAASTAHRSFALLVADGVVTASRGGRARVAAAGAGGIELAMTELRPYAAGDSLVRWTHDFRVGVGAAAICGRQV